MTPSISKLPSLLRHAMQSGFTCQRCLKGLTRLRTSFNRYPEIRDIFNCRWSSSNTRPRATLPATASNPAKLQICRQSSLGTQPQTSNDELPKIRSSPGLADTPAPSTSGNVLLQPNNLFHHFSASPSPEIRRRAAFIKSHAYCPHPNHHRTRMPLSPNDPESRKNPEKSNQPPAHVRFECPDCGIPVSCSEEHWADDYEAHIEICDQLREINEDDHDLRSGRFFPEFEYPGPQMEEAMVNMTNWDTYLYSRDYRAINEERPLRQVTRLLTYPVTIGSIIHQLSPYDMSKSGRYTMEGMKSFSGVYHHFPHNCLTDEIKPSATASILPAPEVMTQ